jgi:two-component system C4-dicarboxylate transport sensor histidine kinase DctB
MGQPEIETFTRTHGLSRRTRALVWISGLWVAPLWLAAVLILRPALVYQILLGLAAFTLAPLPGLLGFRRREALLRAESAALREQLEQLKLQLETLRYRTARLGADLSAADHQARLSHQLTILGQFTAGFLHEFNNPLAILTNRIEILLVERKHDRELCADLEQMLSEARYMGKIAGTLLPALRRQRGEETFNPCIPAEVLQEVAASFGPSVEKQGVRIIVQAADTPQVDLPAHVLSEVVRALVSNALQALAPRPDAAIWLRLDEYHAAGSKVVLRVEDNGPGVPEGLRNHLFEPFVSRNMSRERLGLGLFLSASLLNTYDGVLRYEASDEGGASFVVEMPPARFTKGQPYHWFLKGVS